MDGHGRPATVSVPIHRVASALALQGKPVALKKADEIARGKPGGGAASYLHTDGGDATMRGGERSSGGVPEQDRQGDETHRHGAADGPCITSMTPRNVPERMNELNDGAM